MKTQGYTAAELAGFYAILDKAVCEVVERELQVSIPTMVKRLFDAADKGERDPDRLANILIGRVEPPRQAQAA